MIPDALGRRNYILAFLESKILSFEMIKDFYVTNSKMRYNKKEPKGPFHNSEGCLF